MPITFSQECLDAIKAVRNDKSDVTFVVVGHSPTDQSQIVLISGSNGTIDDMKKSFSSDKVQYGLLRVTSKIDLSTTTKFIYIYNLGQTVPFVQKGRLGIFKGEVVNFFHPYHIDFEIESTDEIDQSIIDNKIDQASGTLNNVRNADFVLGKQVRGYTTHSTASSGGEVKKNSVGVETVTGKNSDNKKSTDKISGIATANSAPSVSMQSTSVKFDDSLVLAIKEMRSDKSETKWVVGAYNSGDINKPVELVGSGNTGVADLKELFKSDMIAYAIVKVVDRVDGHPTTKFGFINWIGESISIMKKAKVSTHKGAVNEKFAPYHVDFTVSEKREISDEIVIGKVQQYSGSKSFVK